MYSPTTRLLTLLELLQSRKQMSGSEIARRLEVDARTVRRYVVMLQDMGIPVEAERGPYGAYQLQRGYKLPPLMFTDAEAVALTMGLLAIREMGFPVDVAAVEGALAKTERVLPEALLNQVRGLQEAITFHVDAPPTQLQNSSVTLLSAAAYQGQQVFLRYRSWNGEESERMFDPYGIVFNEGYWYTAGYCHLRNDLRTFRLDRIVALEAREQTFERPTEFDVLKHVLSSLATMSGPEQVEVVLKTSLEEAQKVILPMMGTLEETAEGVILRRHAGELEWMVYLLVSMDFPVIVKAPEQLRERIRQVGKRAREMVGDEK